MDTQQRMNFPKISWRLLVLAVLFLAAAGIRLYRINEPPMNFHATRQYRSLIIARGYYFDSSSSVPAWEKKVAHFSQQKQGILEPPIMEFLVSIGYRLIGGERLWLPRLLSSVFWLMGGAILYRIGKRIADADSALFSTAFYLFLPFAVVASQSFQPDPLMVMLMLASILAVLRYYDAPSNSRLVVAAVACALAFVVKPGSVFVIVGAFIAIAIWKRGFRAVLNRDLLVFITITVLPTILIYSYGLLTGTFLVGEAQKTLLPQLWISTFFWRGWLTNIENTIGIIPFLGALLGTLIIPRGLPRAFMIGLWIGYVIFCLTLNYNVATHDYYQLQLVPIVGLSIGPIVALVMNQLNRINTQLLWRLAAWGILLVALLFSLVEARARLMNPGIENKVRILEEIGELVHHSTNTVFLSGDYGVPLEYHGLLSGYPWPLASDLEWERLAGLPAMDAEQRYNQLFAGSSPDYFIIIDQVEYEQQKDLKAYLTLNYPVISNSEDYVIFELRQK